VGSQALLQAAAVKETAAAIESLGIPVFLSGMARGLLGRDHPLQLRHRRKEALREADLVLLAGVPCDFRLDYGKHVGRGATLVAVNRDASELTRNRRPALAVKGDPGLFLRLLAGVGVAEKAFGRPGWLASLKARDAARDAEIAAGAVAASEGRGAGVDPLLLCREMEEVLPPSALLVGDGGDFVATASYVLRPRGPLSWLDPGVFGTLGVGAGFAFAAKVARPEADVVLLWGDGAAGYGLVELDTFARHRLGVVAVVGNDASWSQIAREQVDVLGDDVGTVLAATDYHRVADGLGGRGLLVTSPAEVRPALEEALRVSREGIPVLLNVHLRKSAFRKGSISI
jgi:acetolactate synthase-1/2/3 large subunit